MKRITPEDVVDAYIATGMYPAFNKWGTRDGGGGCGLTAIGCLNGQRVKGKHRYEKFSKLLGLPSSYLYGFTCGFDEVPLCPETRKDIEEFQFPMAIVELGHEDGMAARLAVKAHFAKAKKEAAIQAQQAQELELVR